MQGREQQLLQNLATTYKFDPSLISITQPAVTGFASPPAGMSTPGFGQPSSLGGGTPTFGSPAAAPSGGFGAFGSPGGGTSSFGSGSGFGALAQGGQQTGFGAFSSPAAPSPSPFGSTTPFGAPRR